MAATLDRLIYVDDSGHPQSGMVVYGWIECAPDRWAGVLKSWLDTRKKLWREYSIPVTQELHATEYVNGRGRISTSIPDRFVRAGVPYWKDFGRAVAVECLDTLRSTEGLTVGAVWRKGDPRDLARTRPRWSNASSASWRPPGRWRWCSWTATAATALTDPRIEASDSPSGE
nr:hypothetical protein [Jiangella alkaliphila]